jgi:thiamine pyrophosphate-dependent acetolactate synthase large subunit-like protein
MIGTSFPYAEWLLEEGRAKCVEIDIDGSMIGIRYPNDVSLVGDSKDTLQALLPMLERKQDRSWQDGIKDAFPDRPVIAFTGDGAFEMLGMNELLTVKHYLTELCGQNPTLIFSVLVNENLNQVSDEQRVLAADPKNPRRRRCPTSRRPSSRSCSDSRASR